MMISTYWWVWVMAMYVVLAFGIAWRETIELALMIRKPRNAYPPNDYNPNQQKEIKRFFVKKSAKKLREKITLIVLFTLCALIWGVLLLVLVVSALV